MRLKNLLCLLPTGCFKGNNLATVFMMFLGTEGRLACVCALASRPTTDPRHRHAHMRFDSQVRVQEEDETSLPQKIPPSFSFYRSTGWRGHTPWTVVYEAPPLPALSDVAVSQKFSTEPHPAIPRAPPLFSSPVLSESSFSEADAVEEGQAKTPARPALLGGSTETIGPQRTEYHRSRRIHHPAFQRSGVHLAGR